MKTTVTHDIEPILDELKKGKVAVVPTETVYGLAANALDEYAVATVYEIKNRPRFNPVIVHVKSSDQFSTFGHDIDERVYALSEKFSPGPLTYIVRKRDMIPDIVTAGNEGVGLRVSSHPLLRKLLDSTGFPLAAPSANMFGKISPTTAKEALEELDGRVAYILDGGKSEVGIESTVISFMEETPVILRHGGITREEIERVIGKTGSRQGHAKLSPGMTESHYSPVKPLFITNEMVSNSYLTDINVGILDLTKYPDLKSAAVNLFGEMRKLDNSECSIIFCSLVEDQGIGVAINDRLKRASSGYVKLVNGKPEIFEAKHA